VLALRDGSAYGADFGTNYKSGKHSSDTEHLAELKSVVRYRSGQIYQIREEPLLSEPLLATAFFL
jgi:hypothetical protein